MLKKVKLYGKLGERFGKEWELDINSVREATQAIAANNPDFRREFVSSHERGIGYKVIVGDTYLNSEDEAAYPTGKQEIKIIPVVMGAKKKGLGMILLGVAIMTGFYFAGQAAFAASGATQAAMAEVGMGHMINVGAHSLLGSFGAMGMKFAGALILGGIGAMLAPTPKSLDRKDEPENYAFNGPVNTVQQGVPVPVCYGKLLVGGAVISAGIQAEDYNP